MLKTGKSRGRTKPLSTYILRLYLKDEYKGKKTLTLSFNTQTIGGAFEAASRTAKKHDLNITAIKLSRSPIPVNASLRKKALKEEQEQRDVQHLRVSKRTMSYYEEES